MPQLGKKKEKNKFNLQTFCWERFKKQKKLGSGTFGVVYFGKLLLLNCSRNKFHIIWKGNLYTYI